MPSPRTTTRWLVISALFLLAAALFLSPELRETLTGHSPASTHGRAGDPLSSSLSNERSTRSTRPPRREIGREEALLARLDALQKRIAAWDNGRVKDDGDPFSDSAHKGADPSGGDIPPEIIQLFEEVQAAVTELMKFYGENDPEKGMQWLLSHPDGDMVPFAAGFFGTALAAARPDEWGSFLSRIPLEMEHCRWNFGASGIAEVGKTDAAKAWSQYLAMRDDLPEEPDVTHHMPTIYSASLRDGTVRQSLIEANTRQFYEVVKAMNSPEKLQQFFKEARHAPFSETSRILESIADPALRKTSFITYLGSDIAFRSPEDMSQAIVEIDRYATTDSPFRDEALVTLATTHYDPLATLPAAFMISDDTLREQTIQTLRDKATGRSNPAFLQQFETAVQSHRIHSGR